MNTLALDEVLKAVHALPSLPTVVLELLATMGQANVDIGALARRIALDQALTAKTLRLANSSFYGMQRRVTTVNEAIAILGLSSVRNLATAAALIRTLGGGNAGGFNFNAFWRHAIGTALCARAIAGQLGLSREQAYVAGLLHDLGRLVFATQFAGQYAAVLDLRGAQDCDLFEAERAVLGLDHAAVGAALARHWKFPEELQQAVARHHGDEQPDASEMALLVQLADAVAHALDFSNDDDDLVPPLSDTPRQRLGLDDKMLTKVFAEAEREFEAARSVLVQ